MRIQHLDECPFHLIVFILDYSMFFLHYFKTTTTLSVLLIKNIILATMMHAISC